MFVLPVQIRTQLKRRAKRVFKEGRLPAVLYGPKTPSIPVQIFYKDFEKTYKDAGETTLITLVFPQEAEGGASQTPNSVVLIRDVRRHPVKQHFVHVDFYQAPMDEKIVITVPIELEGEAPAVKDEGGTLVHTLYELEVRALPMDLPHKITLDVSSFFHIGDGILVKNLAISPAVEVLTDQETTVAFIEAPAAQEEEIPAATTEEASAADIKTEAEEKREKRAVEEEAEEEGAK